MQEQQKHIQVLFPRFKKFINLNKIKTRIAVIKKSNIYTFGELFHMPYLSGLKRTEVITTS